MITHSELQTLLFECYETLAAHLRVANPQHMVEQLSEEILLKTATRPLPSYALLHASPEARQIFATMIQKNDAVLTAEETRLFVLTHKVERELFLLEINRIKDTRHINALLQNLLSFDLLIYGDRRALTHLTGISLQTFQQGLNPYCSSDELSNFTRAFTWLLSQCATRLREKGSSSNHHLYNSLMKVSLALHSKQCVSEINQEIGPVHMIHFYESTASAKKGYLPVAPRAAEYLNTNGSFNKTSHGLGSGVYGLGALSQAQINEQITEGSNFKIFEIEYPLRLIDNTSIHESEQLTEISKSMQCTCDEITILRNQFKHEKFIYMPNASRMDVVDAFFDTPENKNRLEQWANTLCGFQNINMLQPAIQDILLETIQEFFTHASNKRCDIVPMPINYLLKKLGFTGVVSTMNDRFNRGLVAIELKNSSGLTFIPVKPLTYDASSPRQEIRKSPWSGALTPTALSSRSDDRFTPNERSSSSYGSPTLNELRLFASDTRSTPGLGSPRSSFVASTPPPPEISDIPIQKPSPQRKYQE